MKTAFIFALVVAALTLSFAVGQGGVGTWQDYSDPSGKGHQDFAVNIIKSSNSACKLDEPVNPTVQKRRGVRFTVLKFEFSVTCPENKKQTCTIGIAEVDPANKKAGEPDFEVLRDTPMNCQ